MKTLGQHVLGVILEKKLITAKFNSINRHVNCVPHSHTADQIELAIQEWNEKHDNNWEVRVKGMSHYFTNEKQARIFASHEVPLGTQFVIREIDEN